MQGCVCHTLVTLVSLCLNCKQTSGFSPLYSSDESQLSRWLTTGVSTSKARALMRTRTLVFAHMLKCERFTRVHDHTLNTKSLGAVLKSHRLDTQTQMRSYKTRVE